MVNYLNFQTWFFYFENKNYYEINPIKKQQL